MRPTVALDSGEVSEAPPVAPRTIGVLIVIGLIPPTNAIRDSDPPLNALVLDLEGVDFIDSQGVAKLAELYEVARADAIALHLVRVKPQVRSVLDADGMTAILGVGSIHGNVDRAIQAQLSTPAT